MKKYETFFAVFNTALALAFFIFILVITSLNNAIMLTMMVCGSLYFIKAILEEIFILFKKKKRKIPEPQFFT